MRLMMSFLLVVALSCLAGCASHWGGSEFASDLRPASLGRTAIIIHRPTSETEPLVSNERIHASVAKVLQIWTGATETPLSGSMQGKSDYELVMAARAASVDTVCVITMQSIGQMFAIGIVPPVEHRSYAAFNFRLLDAKTGKLLLEREQNEYTWFPGINKDNALHDLERGLTRTLEVHGYVPQPAGLEQMAAAD